MLAELTITFKDVGAELEFEAVLTCPVEGFSKTRPHNPLIGPITVGSFIGYLYHLRDLVQQHEQHFQAEIGRFLILEQKQHEECVPKTVELHGIQSGMIVIEIGCG